MTDTLKYFLLVTILAGAILLLGEVMYRFLKVKGEYTRKMSHILIGLLPISFPWMFEHHLPVLFLNLQLLLLLLISRRFSLLRSLDDIDRKSFGSFIYPFVIYLLFLIYLQLDNKIYFLLPVVILGICDPIAAISGMIYRTVVNRSEKRSFSRITRSGKTVAGSLAFALSAFFAALFMLPVFLEISLSAVILMAVALSLTATVAEIIGDHGLDNFTIPLAVLLVLIIGRSILF